METAIIVAGGEGRRLRPLTDDTPKALLPVDGVPLLTRWLDALRGSGFSDIRIAVRHRASDIEKFVGGFPGVTCHREAEPRGTAGILHEVGPLHGDVLVVFGDIATDADPGVLRATHYAADSELTVWTAPVIDQLPYGVVESDEQGWVRTFVEKPERSFAVHAGVYACRPSVLEYVPSRGHFDFDTFVGVLLERQRRVRAVPLPGRWIDIGTPSGLDQAQTLFTDE